MGQRANLIIVSNGRREVFYTHHRANTLDQDLFWGPQYAVGFIRSQRPVAADQLLDEVWAEGGAVLDLDCRVLLWFGGEDIAWEIPTRRVHAQLMSHLWRGWEIRWASGGVGDLAEYLGNSVEKLLSSEFEPAADAPNVIEAVTVVAGHPSMVVVSLQQSDSVLKLARVRYHIEEFLLAGQDLVDAAAAANWQDELDLSSAAYPPTGGAHIDVAAKSVDFWIAGWATDIVRRVSSVWPGWTVTWHRDEFEWHLQRTLGHMRFADTDRGKLIQYWREVLLRPNDPKSGAESIVEIAKLLSGAEGISRIDVAPEALYDARLLLPVEQRTALFESAILALERR